uniref:Cytochrome c oxidase subunit 8 n=1 Tax=Equus asinus asinus TaxID=83772 RepID=A0A8C4MZH9_EQUAS
MSRLPILCLLLLLRRRRVIPLGLQLGRRLGHSEPRGRREPASPVEMGVGLVVFFTAFLTPCGYVLSSLKQFRRQ